MKRRLTTVLLVLILAAAAAVNAQAAPLFPHTSVYSGQFTDVQPGDWFYDNVVSLYSLGLTNGKNSFSTFEPGSDMTIAEGLTVAARLRSLHEFGDAEAGAAAYRTWQSKWYEPYVAYLKASGLLSSEFDERFGAVATRAEMAHILAHALPAELFTPINTDAVNIGYATGRYITDVTEYTPYQQDILTLYRLGILSGTDSSGSFQPDSAVRRSEAAAMVTRLVDSDLRITLVWNIAEDPMLTSLADLIPSEDMAPTAPDPNDSTAVDAALRYALSRGERTLILRYPTPSTENSATAVMNAFLSALRAYPEQNYNKVSVSYSTSSGKMTLTFSSSLYSPLMINAYREQIFSAAMQVRDALYRDKILTDSMTEYDKALAYFTWLCDHCAYDEAADATSMSHSAYNAFFENLAVCDGYTAAYNLLLKLEGIQCRAFDSREWDHMWTIATLDGVTYHIDPTWGDRSTSIDYRYFAMTEADSIARFH